MHKSTKHYMGNAIPVGFSADLPDEVVNFQDFNYRFPKSTEIWLF